MSRRDYISASQLKTFRTCPKQYWYKYASDIEPTKAEKGYRPMGGAVHEAIENVLREYPDLDDRAQLEYKLKAELKDMQPLGIPESLEDRAFTCVANAAHFIAREDWDILGVEEKHKFEVNRPDLSHPFLAIMDVTTERGIYDWKTGNQYKDAEKLQGAVYLAAYTHKYGRVPEFVKFVYLKDRESEVYRRTDGNGHEFWSETKQPDGWETVIDLSKRLLKAWDEETWPAKPGKMCHWCDYQLYCHEGGVGAENIAWEKY